jgi:putative DNA primase/helicase
MVKINGKGDKRMFSLVTDLPKLRKKIEEIGNVALVVIDPLSAYLGRTKQVDTFRTTDVRNVLAPFTDLAAELNVAIIAIMHFNKKVDVTNMLLRVSDSAAFTAAARHLYGVIDDRPNKRKLFVRGKNNVASSEQKTLAYQFGLRMVGNDADGEEIWAPHILWEPNPVDITPSEAMSSGNGRLAEARANAKDFLKKKLAGGASE